jgi:hypothetical protein
MLNRTIIILEMIPLLSGYLLLGFFKHLVPLGWLARWMWRSPACPRDLESERHLTASVLRLSRLPDCNCLQLSLILYHVLSRAGANPTLVVGFRRMNGQMLGHAWVIVDDRAIIEAGAGIEYLPVFAFGARGALLPTQPDLAPRKGCEARTRHYTQ